MRRAVLLLLCIVTSGGAAAAEERSASQAYVWRSWTRLDGLPGSQVWAITQDHSGYIWIGTNEGLIRFDGVRFVSGRQLGLDPLPNASVRALFVARDGSVWIGFGTGGIGRLKDGRLQTYTMDDGLPPGVVAGLVEDRHGNIWAASANGLYRLAEERWSRIDLESGVPARAVNAVYVDRSGRLWVGSRAGAYRNAIDAPTRFDRVTSAPSLSLAGDDAGNVWSVGEASLALLTASSPRTVVEAAAYAPGRRMTADRQGRLWVGTLGDGLLRVNPTGPGIVVEKFNRPGVSSYDDVLAVFEDRESNIWVGTPRGLDRGSRGLIRSLPEPGDGITAPVQAVAAAADGSVWVGTTNGVHRFADGRHDARTISVALPSRGVLALHGDAGGGMWVATARAVGRVEHDRFVSLIPVGTVLNRPVAMATDHQGRLWLCDLERGVFRWDGKTLVAVPVEQYGNRPAFSILADRAGRIWTGHLDGTISVHENGRARLYTAADGVIGSVVTGFFEGDGAIWAGSRNGLMRFRDGRIDAVTWDQGLPGHTVTAITGDSLGNLWLGVSAGVARFRPEDFDKVVTGAARSLPYTLYDGSDGLRGDPFPSTAPAVARGGDGRLWFLTSDGVAVVSPDSHEKNRAAAPVVIETVTTDQGAVPLGGDRRLPPRTANLRIDYTALSFVAPEKVRFSYRMEGFDADWVDAGTRRQAFYTNLAPGNYRFRVRASNDGVPSEREAVWAFALAPAFYQTGWFVAALVLLALSAVALAWRVRVQQVQGRFSAILVERTRVAREVHDTLLQSLLGVLFRLDEVATVIDQSSESAKDQLVRLRRQVEFYVREARYSIRDLRSPILQSRGLATALRSIGENLTGEGAVTFRLDVIGHVRADLQRVDEHLLRIGQEAMTNAVRHGGAATVIAELTYRQDAVSLSVRDDGKGFDTALATVADGVHWGLRTMRERAEQIGGTLRITSAEGQGTVVEVVVPTPYDVG